MELAADWQIVPQLSVGTRYLFTQPTIDRADERTLEGNLLAQTPQHVVSGTIEWKPASKWFVTAQVRYNGRQFEDDQNTTELAAFTVADAAVAYDLSDRISASFKIENIFNAEIETGKSVDGLVSIGAPRLATLQVQFRL